MAIEIRGDNVVKNKPAVNKNKRLDSSDTTQVDFHGASIINEEGEEIPITEKMVRKACDSFIKQWEPSQEKDPED